MVLQSTRWLALGYFTYFFSYGIFLPFWSAPRQRSFSPDFRLARAGTADTSLCCRILGGGARSVADAGDDWL